MAPRPALPVLALWATPLLMAGCSAAPPPAPATPPAEDPLSGVRVFTGEGAPASWDALEEAARDARIILLGEAHDDPVGHRARHHLVERLAAGEACRAVVVSLEMFETDVQVVLDEYLEGLITEEHFLRAARPWPGYEERYRPYVERARRCGDPVVAANPPRRYVNRVARMGQASLEDLSEEPRRWLPPLPVAPPSERYREEWSRQMAEAAPEGHGAAAHPHGHGDTGDDPVLQAQNLWDAGMAYAVARSAEAHPEAKVVHVAGSFHVAGGTGIPEHLARYLPGAEPLIVVAYPVEKGAPFDPDRHGGRGEFVLLTDR